MKLRTKPIEKPCFVRTRSRLELLNEMKLRTKPLEKPRFVRTRSRLELTNETKLRTKRFYPRGIVRIVALVAENH